MRRYCCALGDGGGDRSRASNHREYSPSRWLMTHEIFRAVFFAMIFSLLRYHDFIRVHRGEKSFGLRSVGLSGKCHEPRWLCSIARLSWSRVVEGSAIHLAIEEALEGNQTLNSETRPVCFSGKSLRGTLPWLLGLAPSPLRGFPLDRVILFVSPFASQLFSCGKSLGALNHSWKPVLKCAQGALP